MNIQKTMWRGVSISAALRTTSVAVLAASLAACGGGGGGSGGGTTTPPTPPPTNSAPSLTGNLAQIFGENSDIGFSLNVEDADGDTVTITIGDSGDGQFFTLNTGTGEIRGTQQFNFEAPEDVNGDNVYEQTVTLNDGTVSVTETVTVEIVNVDEAPVCDVTEATSIRENETGAIGQISGTDPDAGDIDTATFSNLMISDQTIEDSVSLNSQTGELSLTAPLDAEAFPADFSFTVEVDINTTSFSDRCTQTVSLTDIPNRITSGIIFDAPVDAFVTLSDLDGLGAPDLWVPDAVEQSSDQITGSIIFGEAFAAAVAADGTARVDFEAFSADQKITVSGVFNRGGGNTATSMSVFPISDLDGDGVDDLFFGSEQPPNDGFDMLRHESAYIVFSQTIADNMSGAIDLNSLADDEGLSLTGEVDLNGSLAQYTVEDLDGIAGDEILISMPGALGPGSESGKIFIVNFADMDAAVGNLDFDSAPNTQTIEGTFEIDAQLEISTVDTIGDLDADGVSELLLIGQQSVNIIPSVQFVGLPGQSIDSFSPLVLDLETERPYSFATADADGDNLDDLLIVRNQSAAGRQGSLVFGAALAPIVESDSTLALNDTNFNAGDFVDFSSDGTGAAPSEPNVLIGLGDLDGDGLDEVAFSQFSNESLGGGPVYILRGSALTGRADTDLSLAGFTAAMGTRISSVPFLYSSNQTAVSRIPDIDADGIAELYVATSTVNSFLPDGAGLVIKSTDIAAALDSNALDVDLETLFFDETPQD